LLRELEELSERKEEGYDVVISFKEGVKIRFQAPLWLYLKHFSSPKPTGYDLVTGFDLNSDRLNVVVIDKEDRVITTRAYRYSEVTRLVILRRGLEN